MPQKDSHVNQAIRNLKFIDAGAQCYDIVGEYCEWYMTVKFYTALHLIDAVLAINQFHPSDHKARNTGIFKLKTMFSLNCANRYHELYNFSKKARYLQGNAINSLKQDLNDFEIAFEEIKNEIEEKHGIKI